LAECCLGLIVGLGVGATVHYYQELVKNLNAQGRIPQLIMIHADMRKVLQYVADGKRGQLARYLSDLISRTQAGGAHIAAIPAVTPHICMEELQTASPLPIVNLLEAIREEIQVGKLRRVAVFGTRFSIETSLFHQLESVTEVVLPKPEEIDYIHTTYMRTAERGQGCEEDRRGLTELAHKLCEREGVEAILLAGTDLSVLFDAKNTSFPCIDSAQVHIQAILKALRPVVDASVL